MSLDVIILGAGAAGLMTAIVAGKRGARVLVLDHAKRMGQKILISGGGRCNFTNLYSGPHNFISSNPDFCKSALARFKPENFLNLVQKHQIEYFEKTPGQLFCKISAKQMVTMLESELNLTNVEIQLSTSIHNVQKLIQNPKDKFVVKTNRGDFSADSLVVATGGLSFAKLGASALGYQIARQFGLKVTQTAPALVPLVFEEQDRTFFSHLSGISFEAQVKTKMFCFVGSVLFTHLGLSGPAILQISSYWKPGETVFLDLFHGFDLYTFLVEEKKRGQNSELKNILSGFLPRRFIETWIEHYFRSQPLQQYSNKDLGQISSALKKWEIHFKCTEGYQKAEVTLGGVDTTELSSKTLESKKVNGLYFVGEVLDVTGHLGGHNFQWAWASGFAAGQAIQVRSPLSP